jgi:hypothetical protein
MKHFRSVIFASALAATSLGVAQAQPYGPPPGPPPGPGYYHHWHHGDRYYGHPVYVHHWSDYHLPPPPPGTVWVHDGPNFLALNPGGVIIRVWGG